MSDYQVVFCTCANLAAAEKLAGLILESHLAACIQLTPKIISMYRWENKVVQEHEVLMTMKTTAKQYSALEALIIEHHDYDVPEIIAVDIEKGYQPYLSWLNEECSS